MFDVRSACAGPESTDCESGNVSIVSKYITLHHGLPPIASPVKCVARDYPSLLIFRFTLVLQPSEPLAEALLDRAALRELFACAACSFPILCTLSPVRDWREE